MAVAVPLLAGVAGQAIATNIAWGIAAQYAISTTTFSAIVSAGFMVGSAVGAAMVAPDMPSQEGPRAMENKVNDSSYGAVVAIPYGRVRIAGNVIWDYGICEVETTEEVGGKGGGDGAEITSYTYFDSWAVALCEGEVTTIHKIWFDAGVVYDAQTNKINEAIKDKFDIYYGDDIQEADPLIEAVIGFGKTPAYRGICYVVFDNVLLEDWGNRIPNVTVELTRSIPALAGTSKIYPIDNIDHLDSSSQLAAIRSTFGQIPIIEPMNVAPSLVFCSLIPYTSYEAYSFREDLSLLPGLNSASLIPYVDYVSYALDESMSLVSAIQDAQLVPYTDYIPYVIDPESLSLTPAITGASLESI